MLDRGANPYIRDAEGVTHFDRYSLFNLKNLPSVKSAFFTTKKHPIGDHSEPWCYTPGVYDGNFIKVIHGKKDIEVIAKGGEGTVIRGDFYGPAAYKFVEMTGLNLHENYDNNTAEMAGRLMEMETQSKVMETPGDAILPLEAHYR